MNGDTDPQPAMLILLMVAGCFALAQTMAVFTGLQCIGVPWWAAVLFLPALVLMREIGALPAALLGYVGATRGWEWDWWQALLLCVPFFVFTVALYVLLTKSSMLVSLFRITRPQKL